jgi:hypothetical protein
MSYIGNNPTQQAFTPAVDYFNGNGSSVAFTLSRPVASVAQVQVVIENVPQNPSSAYTVSGNTITFTSAPPSGTSNIYVEYTSPITQVIAPGQGTVSTAQLGNINNINSLTSLALQTNNGTTAVTIDASQNVGIGTSSPSVNLNVYKSSDGIAARFQRSSGGGLVDIETYNGIGGIGTADNIPFRLNTNNTERMRIDSSGNVGIGTASPTSKMEVAVGTAGGSLNITNTANTNTPKLRVTTSQSSMDFGEDGTGGFIEQLGAYPIRFYNNNSERMRIDSSGNLLVGTTTAAAVGSRLSIKGSAVVWGCGPTSGNDSFFVYNASSVGVYLGNGGTSWSSSSDERLKTDLIPIENGLDKVISLRSVTGRFKTDEVGTSRSFLIAQDVQAVLPEAVSVQDDELGTLGVAYTEVIPLLVASIKELKAIIDTQNARIEALEAK